MGKELFIDVETYSSVDLKESGAYKYMASDDFEILLIGFAIGNGPVKVVDLAQGEEIPEELDKALRDPEYLKIAHNAVFERLALQRIGYNIPAIQFYCTSVKAAYCGLPLSLEEVSKALDLTEKKLDTGKLLIKYFSCPCKPTKANGWRQRNHPSHDPQKWELYKTYNDYDVRAEREIYRRLEGYKIPERERETYALDQRINDRGILVDMNLALSAVRINEDYSKVLEEEAKKLTGLENPNSVTQLKKWIQRVSGEVVESLGKGNMDEIREVCKDSPRALRMLDIRSELSKSSVKKYNAMINCAGADNRVRGTFQFYGANRTGRWAGRLLQLQNLSKNHIEDLDTARSIVKSGDWEHAKLVYGDVADILSQLVRTAIIAPEGKTLCVADFSAIEARVISWLASEEWRLEVFRGDGKIYEATGSKMFNVPVSKITKGSDLRAKSKISELALGFGGGVKALERMGGDKMGLSDTEMSGLVAKWRKANPRIVDMWAKFEKCAIYAVKYHKKVNSGYRGVSFDCDGDFLTIELPSGRKLFYANPSLSETHSHTEIRYYGVNQKTRQWSELSTYGGKLTENIVQAIARDLLANAMMHLDDAGYEIVMHIHDEAVCEIPDDGKDKERLEQMEQLMCITPEWAADLPLNADGYVTPYYKKD